MTMSEDCVHFKNCENYVLRPRHNKIEKLSIWMSGMRLLPQHFRISLGGKPRMNENQTKTKSMHTTGLIEYICSNPSHMRGRFFLGLKTNSSELIACERPSWGESLLDTGLQAGRYRDCIHERVLVAWGPTGKIIQNNVDRIIRF